MGVELVSVYELIIYNMIVLVVQTLSVTRYELMGTPQVLHSRLTKVLEQ